MELASFGTRGKGRAQNRRGIRGNPWTLKFPESTMDAMEEILALIEGLRMNRSAYPCRADS